MRSLKRVASLVLVVFATLACIAGLYISATNRDVIVIDLLFWPALAVRSGLLVTLAFSAGALMGILVATVAANARWRGQPLKRNGLVE